jgi:hypothetical protein
MSEGITLTPEVLEAALANYLGITPTEVRPTLERLVTAADTVEQISPIVTSQWREQQLGSLREAWGDEFQTVYDHVTKQVFPNLSPEQQALYNNADGLKFLAEQNRGAIEQALQSSSQTTPQPVEQVQGQNQPEGAIAPTNGGGVSNAPSASPTFTQSQLLAMTPAEWKQNESAIQQAYASGSVVQDVE